MQAPSASLTTARALTSITALHVKFAAVHHNNSHASRSDAGEKAKCDICWFSRVAHRMAI
eukprot:6173938-Pleurochrysis_carterae.AAC.2